MLSKPNKSAITRGNRPSFETAGDIANTTPAHKPNILAVLTRELDSVPVPAGRLNTLARIQDGLALRFQVSRLRLSSVVEQPHPVSAALRVSFRFLWQLLTFRPMALQCALFDLPPQVGALTALVECNSVNSVYLNSIRCVGVLYELRRRSPNLRIVIDLDDLMSRRMGELKRKRLSISTGYLTGHLSKTVVAIARSRFIAWLLLSYEHAALRRAERNACACADAVVLVSSQEAAELAKLAGPSRRAQIIALPPPTVLVREVRPRRWPIRFVFVGSDFLVQNRLTIDFLLQLWSRACPSSELHVVGQQQHVYAKIANVVMRGAIPDLSYIYDEHAVLLCPSFVAGGIKTKVAEAFGYGIPAVLNRLSAEGFEIDGYPLVAETEEILVDIVCHPDFMATRIRPCRRHGAGFRREGAKSRSLCPSVAGHNGCPDVESGLCLRPKEKEVDVTARAECGRVLIARNVEPIDRSPFAVRHK